MENKKNSSKTFKHNNEMTNNEKYESIAKLIINWCNGLKIPYMPMGITEVTHEIQMQYPNVKYSSGIVLNTPNQLGHGDVLFLFDRNRIFIGIELSNVSSNRLSLMKNDGMFNGIPFKTISMVGMENVYLSF